MHCPHGFKIRNIKSSGECVMRAFIMTLVSSKTHTHTHKERYSKPSCIYCTQAISICTNYTRIPRDFKSAMFWREQFWVADRRGLSAQTAEVQGVYALQYLRIIPHMIKIRSCSGLTQVLRCSVSPRECIFIENPDFQMNLWFRGQLWRLGN